MLLSKVVKRVLFDLTEPRLLISTSMCKIKKRFGLKGEEARFFASLTPKFIITF